MKPLEAIQLLDSAVSQMSLNREQHHQLQQAISTLVQEVQPKEPACDEPADPREQPADDE